MTNEEFKAECKENCSDIFNKSIANPKEWLWSKSLDMSEEGKYLRVMTCYGGHTEWWTFNQQTHSGRYYYHYGSVLVFKNFGKVTYERLMKEYEGW